MSVADHDTAGESYGHGSKKSYLVGFAMSAVLTAIPFWLAMSGIFTPTVTAVAVVAMAVVAPVVVVVMEEGGGEVA